MRDSINALKEKGGDAYIEVMKQEGLRQDKNPDIEILMQLAERYSQNEDINLYDMKSTKIKKSSAFLCMNLKKQIKEMRRDFKSQDRSPR